jgi:hypothetical protein
MQVSLWWSKLGEAPVSTWAGAAEAANIGTKRNLAILIRSLLDLWWILDYLKSSHIFDVVANLQNAQCCLSGCSMAFTVQLEGRFRAEAAERALEAVERRGLCAISLRRRALLRADFRGGVVGRAVHRRGESLQRLALGLLAIRAAGMISVAGGLVSLAVTVLGMGALTLAGRSRERSM